MSTSPRLSKKSQTAKPATSSSMVIVYTALDTTWRAFVPTLGGTFIGIGLDNLLNIAPVATIVCLILGTALSAFLIARQLISVRNS